MTISVEIDKLVANAKAVVPQAGRNDKIFLYGEGVKSKLTQAEYSLAELQSYSNKSDESTTTTNPEEATISDRVGFYCDAYWAFLYSALDVMAHLINQAQKLGMDEKDVSFKQIANRLRSGTLKNSNLQKKVEALLRSNAFKNLDAYRNCSTHRRQIYYIEEVKIVKHTAGYYSTSTGEVRSVERIICDNPLQVKPKITQNRKIPEYMIKTQTKIHQSIMGIVKNITPII